MTTIINKYILEEELGSGNIKKAKTTTGTECFILKQSLKLKDKETGIILIGLPKRYRNYKVTVTLEKDSLF